MLDDDGPMADRNGWCMFGGLCVVAVAVCGEMGKAPSHRHGLVQGTTKVSRGQKQRNVTMVLAIISS